MSVNGLAAAGPSNAVLATIVRAPHPIGPVDGSQYFVQRTVATLPSPWSLAFLPDGRMLVTERPAPGLLLNPTAEGHLRVVTPAGAVSVAVTGTPANVGVLDVILDPHFAQNHTIYFSYLDRDPYAARVGRDAADPGVDPVGVAVARAVIDLNAPGGPALTSSTVIWHQFPDIVSFPGSGEPGGRLTFSPDGAYLFIAAGDRQEFGPVQDLDNTLGKIVRIFPDGTIPADNPFVGVVGARPEIWSLGHRNPYGLVFDADGKLWENEMGPKGGDELNVILPSSNYGWPNVSYGNNYDGSLIPKPASGDGYAPSPLFWDPVIAPSGMIAYSGHAFPEWTGDLIISGLQSKGLVVVDTDGDTASELMRIDLGARIRDVVQAPDGTLLVLTDRAAGQIVSLAPRAAVIAGTAGNDTLFGTTGNDRISGGGAPDRLGGSGGSDVFIDTAAGLNGDTIGDFGLGDHIVVTDVGIRQANVTLIGVSLTFTGGALTLSDHPAGRVVVDAAVGGGVDISLRAPATNDFNGDGRSDILWRNGDGTVTDWLGTVGGGASENAANIFRRVSADWKIVGTGDFNGDGGVDLLWRNANGTLTTWLSAANGSFVDNASNFSRIAPADWKIAGTGDFNGDGRSDILWSTSSGTVTDWLGTATGSFSDNVGNFSRGVPTGWMVAGVGDFDGDGTSDVLWRSASGAVTNWLGSANGGLTDNAAGVFPTALPGWVVAGIGDFNGDGRSDVLWRTDNGTVTDWLGTANGGFADNGGTIFRPVPSAWTIIATGDYNGDAMDDILWRNDDGKITNWLGTADGGFADHEAEFLRDLPSGWNVKGIGDFNGDGRSDVLWRNSESVVADWMGTATGGMANNDANLFRGVAADWTIAAIGDFNGDGRSDILWRNSGGTVADWLGNAKGSFGENDANLFRNVSADWTIAATGDFNGDGRDDILWRNSNGTVTNWLGTANGGFTDNDNNIFRSVSADWTIVGTGDFNGDGRSDILWRNSLGVVTDWLGKPSGGLSDNDGTIFRSVSLDWTIVGIGDVNGDGRSDILWRNSLGIVTDWLGKPNGGFGDNEINIFRNVSADWTIAGTGDFNGDGRDDILWRNANGTVTNWLGSASGGFMDNDNHLSIPVETTWSIQPEHFAA